MLINPPTRFPAAHPSPAPSPNIIAFPGLKHPPNGINGPHPKNGIGPHPKYDLGPQIGGGGTNNEQQCIIFLLIIPVIYIKYLLR